MAARSSYVHITATIFIGYGGVGPSSTMERRDALPPRGAVVEAWEEWFEPTQCQEPWTKMKLCQAASISLLTSSSSYICPDKDHLFPPSSILINSPSPAQSVSYSERNLLQSTNKKYHGQGHPSRLAAFPVPPLAPTAIPLQDKSG